MTEKDVWNLERGDLGLFLARWVLLEFGALGIFLILASAVAILRI